MSTDLIEISNDLRTFTIPSNTILGVEHDMDVNELKFVAPRYFHQDVDLSELSIQIHYQSSDGNKYYRPAINITVSDTALYFSWLVNSVKRTICPRGRRNHKWLIHLAKR